MAHPPRPFLPKLNRACDMRSLAITPLEAFVLSRVDGMTDTRELAVVTGLGDEVLTTLRRLYDLGALADWPAGLGGASPIPAPVEVAPQPISRGATPSPPRVGPSTQVPQAADASRSGKRIDPRAEDEGDASDGRARASSVEHADGIELDDERRGRIVAVFEALERSSHYEVLGVDRQADKREIKSAYFKLAQEFHPDRYFRKRLGPFKPKLEAIFRRVTEAHDTLAKAALREAYDGDLATRTGASGSSSRLTPQVSAPLASSRRARVSPTPTTGSPTPPQGTPSLSRGEAAPEPKQRSSVEESGRRQALASKLAGSKSAIHDRPRSSPPPPPEHAHRAPTPPVRAGENALDGLRHLAHARLAEAARGQFERYLESAQHAAERNDPVAAVNAYRLALSMMPGDARLTALTREWGQKAAVQLSVSYRRRGRAEADEGRWGDAARSFARALAGAPDDVELLEWAATALARSAGDMHQAAEFARKAISLAPTRIDARLALAEVYLAANLGLNARRELDAAAKIDANHPTLKVLLKRLS